MPNQKEYRVCMPLTVEEYRVGQLYMINKHSLEQSEKGEGVEIIKNEPYYDEVHGQGQFTEKRVHLNSKLPKWIQGYCPKVFYIIEKAWNYYPYTVTEYECSFIPRFNVLVKTCYLNDNGSTENALGLTDDERKNLEVEHLDIAFDPLAERYYKAEEDPRYFQSAKTGRGPLVEGWRMDTKPIMCSYKYVRASFEVWGLAGTVESYVHSTVKDILIGGHRQAFAWIDEWHGMTLEDVRAFEEDVMKETNIKVVGVNTKEDSEQDKKALKLKAKEEKRLSKEDRRSEKKMSKEEKKLHKDEKKLLKKKNSKHHLNPGSAEYFDSGNSSSDGTRYFSGSASDGSIAGGSSSTSGVCTAISSNDDALSNDDVFINDVAVVKENDAASGDDVAFDKEADSMACIMETTTLDDDCYQRENLPSAQIDAANTEEVSAEKSTENNSEADKVSTEKPSDQVTNLDVDGEIDETATPQ